MSWGGEVKVEFYEETKLHNKDDQDQKIRRAVALLEQCFPNSGAD